MCCITLETEVYLKKHTQCTQEALKLLMKQFNKETNPPRSAKQFALFSFFPNTCKKRDTAQALYRNQSLKLILFNSKNMREKL